VSLGKSDCWAVPAPWRMMHTAVTMKGRLFMALIPSLHLSLAKEKCCETTTHFQSRFSTTPVQRAFSQEAGSPL